MHGSVAATAEAVFDGLGDADRNQLRVLLMRMVQPGDGTSDSRRRVDLAELRELGQPESTERLIEQLAAARLVTVDGTTVQPAHEALLRAWPRLVEWIDEQRNDLRRHRHLTAASQAWTKGGRDAAELYRGARLDGAIELALRSSLTATEQSFLGASVDAEAEAVRRSAATNRRLRMLITGVAAALVIAVIAATIAVVQLTRASNQRRRADAASVNADTSRLGAEARAVMAKQLDLALLLALEANGRSDTPETRDSLLEALTAHPQLAAKLHGVDSGLWSVAWSHDGTRLAATTADSTGTVVWDGIGYQPVGRPLATGDQLQIDFDAAFTPDGRTLVVAGIAEDRTPGAESATTALQIWDTATSTLRASTPLLVLPEAAEALDDRRALVVGSPIPAVWVGEEPERAAAIQVVDLESGIAGPPQTVVTEPLAAAIVGSSLLIASSDGTLIITDYENVAAPAQTTVDLDALLDPEDIPTLLAYDAVHQRVAIAGESGSIILADLVEDGPAARRGVAIRRIDTHGDFPSAVAFSPDGSLLAVGGYFGSTQLYNGASGIAVGPLLAALAGEVRDLSFDPAGARLAVAGLDGTGSVWRLDGSRPVGVPNGGHSDAVVATAPLPDGRTVLTASFDGSVVARDADSNAVRWVVDTGEPIVTATLDPTGSRLAVGGAEGQLEVLDTEDGTTVSGPATFQAPIQALAWTPDSATIAIGAELTDDGINFDLEFVDATSLEATGEAVTTVNGSAISLAFSPDGSRLAVTLDSNVVRLVDVATRSLQSGYLESPDVPFFSVAWSPDGRRIATGTAGGTVQLWDARTLTPGAPAGRANFLPIRGLTFSPDGTLLASTTEFSTSRLWDAETGAPIGGDLVGGELPITVTNVPEPERPEIPFVPGFSRDGRVLYAGGDEPVAWSLDLARWRAAACALAGRDLSPEEWAQYLPGQQQHPICVQT